MRKFRTTLLGAFLFALLLAPLFTGCNPSVGNPSVGPDAYDMVINITVSGQSSKTLYVQFPEDYDEYSGDHTLIVFNDAACTQKNNNWDVSRQGPLLRINNTSLNVIIRAFPSDDDKIYYNDTDTQISNLVIDGETFYIGRVM